MQFLNLVSASLSELKALVRCWSSCEGVSVELREGSGNAYFVELGFNLRQLVDVEILEGYLSVGSGHPRSNRVGTRQETTQVNLDLHLFLRPFVPFAVNRRRKDSAGFALPTNGIVSTRCFSRKDSNSDAAALAEFDSRKYSGRGCGSSDGPAREHSHRLRI